MLLEWLLELVKYLRIEQSGNEPGTSDNVDENVHVDAQPSNDNDIEIEPVVDLDNPQSNQRYDKRDFVARRHGK